MLAGGLLFYDFGMMSEIGTARRGSLLELFYGVYRRDADAVIAALIDLGIIVPTADAVSLRRAISFSLDNLLRKVSSGDVSLSLGGFAAAAAAAVHRLIDAYE